MPEPLERLFSRPKPVIAIVHVGPSPGAPGAAAPAWAAERALTEARVYAELGVDGLLLENAHDAPALPEHAMGPEVATFMTRVAANIKRQCPRMVVGIQVRTGATRTALAVALAAGCDFVRTERWGARTADDCGAALRYRKLIGAENVPIWADLRRPRRAQAFDPAEAAYEAERHRADGLVVAGPAPGHAPEPDDLAAAAEGSDLPLFVGTGVTAENLADYVALADGFFVGSGLKEHGDWRAPVCEKRVRALVGAVEYARGRETVTLR